MSIADKMITIADNTPAVAEAVNAAKATASGTAIRVDDVLNTEHPLQVQTTAGAKVTVTGKNLVDYTKAKGRNANQAVEIVDGGVLWKAGGDFYFEIPVSLPAGVTVTANATGENAAGEKLLNYTLVYEDKTYAANKSLGYPQTPEMPVVLIRFYKTQPGTALTQDLLVSNIQLELGTAKTAYEPYETPQTATADSSGKVEGLHSVSPTMTIFSDNGEAVQCTYFPQSAAGTYAKYQELKLAEITLKELTSNG